MHYYKFNIADYIKDTAHLTMMEEGAYRRLLDLYYLNDGHIPEETKSVFRRLRAITEEEQKVVETVLNEFFEFTGKWTHKRCDEEIAAYQAKVERAKTNGKQGGRPKYNENQTETDSVSSGFQKETESKANSLTQELTNSKEKKNIKKKISSPWRKFDFSKWPEVPSAETLDAIWKVRKAKKQADTQLAVDLIGAQLAESLADGYSFAQCIDEWVLRGWGAFKAEWMRNSNQARASPSAHGGFEEIDYSSGIGPNGEIL